MSTSIDELKEDIKTWIKRRLGYPVVMVELTSEQLEVCIDDALDEIAPWIVNSKYITLPVQECIDLSEYNVAYVIRVHKGEKSGFDAGKSLDVFSPITSMSMVSTSLRSGLDTFSAIAKINAESTVINNTFKSMKDNISFRYIKPNLYLDIGYPLSQTCTIQYSEKIKDILSIEDDEFYMRMLKKFSLAYARLMLYEIRGKYTVNNSPTTLNGDTELSQANDELEKLREELKSTIITDFIID